jgi:hypothetical protein
LFKTTAQGSSLVHSSLTVNSSAQFINGAPLGTIINMSSATRCLFYITGMFTKMTKTDLFCTIALSYSIKLHSLFTVFWQERGLPVLFSTDQSFSPKHYLHMYTAWSSSTAFPVTAHTVSVHRTDYNIMNRFLYTTTKVPILNWVMEQGTLTQNRSNLHRQFALVIHISRVRFG